MVLRTFHFAGVQERQVTQGLPRLIEIFDARKKPSSPKMEIYLEKDYNDEKNARVFAEKIKETKLKDISSEINIDFSDKKLEVIIDAQEIKQIHTTIKKVVERLSDLGHKVKEKPNSISVNVADVSFKDIYKLKQKLIETKISGIKDVKQVLIVKKDRDYVVLTLGTNLKEILKCKEVNKNKTISNDLHEMAETFGIEVGRQLIIREIQDVLSAQGLDIDMRHLKLAADAMTNTGVIKGVTRMGIIAQKSSILARATFETPVKQFVNATIKGSKDKLTSVIENIILNQPVPIGTGLPGLLVKVIGPLTKREDELKKAKKEIVKKVGK